MVKKPIKATLRYEVKKRDCFSCLWCQKGIAENVKLNVDHIIPEAFGGETTIDNLATLCENCNKSKGTEYHGNYLLTTLFKLKELDKYLTKEEFEKGYRCSIEFFVEIESANFYSKKTIFHFEPIPEDYLYFKKEEDSYKIKKSEIRRKAIITLKEKLRDYLLTEGGYLEELEGSLIFRKGKQKDG